MTFFIKGVRRAVPPMIDGVEDSSSFVVAMAILSMVNISLSLFALHRTVHPLFFVIPLSSSFSISSISATDMDTHWHRLGLSLALLVSFDEFSSSVCIRSSDQ